MIIITGAAGFIGSAIASALNKRGQNDLILVDKFGEAEKWTNLLGLRFHQFVDRAFLFDELDSAPWAKQVEAVIHMGACADTTMKDVDFLNEWNVEYSRLLCEWCLDNDVRFVYASSAATYGDGSLGFSDDDALTPKLKPLNAYGFSKWMFDCMVLDRGWQDKVAGLRFFNVFGPNEYHKLRMASVIFHAYPQVRDTGKVMLFESHRDDYGHGEQRRDFIYIEEVLEGVLFALDNKKVNGIFNLGTGTPHTFNQLAENVCKGLGREVNIEYFPMPEDLRGRYQYHTAADMSRLQAAGFKPFPDKFADYVQSYVRDYLNRDYLKLQDR